MINTNMISEKKTNVRWIVASGLSLSFMVMFLGRTVFSVSGPAIMKEFGWTSTQFGYASTAFFIGYMISMIPSGAISDKYGASKVLIVSLLLAGLFTFLTPIIGTSIGLMIVIRAFEGFSQGGIVPGAMSNLGKWAAKKESGIACGLVQAGCPLGSAINMYLAAALLPIIGWHKLFYVYAIFFPLWCIIWAFIGKSDPSKHKKVNQAELAYIQKQEVKAEVTNSNITKVDVMRTPAVWLMCLSYACATYMYFFCTTWLPNYFIIGRGMKISAGATPYIVGFFTYFIGGFVADAASNKFGNKIGRKLVQVVGMIGAGVLIFLGANATDPTLVIVAVSASYGFLCLTMGGYFSVAPAICSTLAGVYAGLAGVLGAIAGVLAPTITGIVVDAGLKAGASNATAYGYALWICGGICIVGSILALAAKIIPVQHKEELENN
ncbi:MFS transporter [Clostridium estertheticum]|uniref:MFS transporter n=1 Tax=Clostridium estertheticum TaxID=238834 RepID=UPI001C0E8391|nr:MFS transporter [Clostridium estertheticum]MBU3218445.1 MFS transporter [Clostridium estertheticum]MCB2362519.1 MFS transporter [Clostridium estertheticum]WAG56013.1 MFS transporter [Clostridium estertheticum]